MANRRAFIAGLLAAGLAPKPSWSDVGSPGYLAAARKPDGTYVLCGLSAEGAITFERTLPARGHAAAGHPARPEAVVFARRPGTYAIVLDCMTGQEKARLEAPSSRHFYGHGVFSADGDLLFTTENDFDAARGLIGIWDARLGYTRLGEFASGGIGPHDIKLMPDDNTLVIANGGIETHPDSGRTKLNIATMRPNLSYAGPDGHILEQIALDDRYHKNSIRHLAISGDATVAFAMQWQGDQTDYPPLLGLHRRGDSPRLCTATRETNRRMAGYAGSIAISDAAQTIAITSPRGGTIQVYDARSGDLKHMAAMQDVCGVANGEADFLVTTGLGVVALDPSTRLSNTTSHNLSWDNHLIAL